MNTPRSASPVDESAIAALIDHASEPEPLRVRDILARARELRGLPDADIVTLMAVTDPDTLTEIHRTARFVKDTIYGNRLVLFAPLYVSNMCANECLYCAFRASNRAVHRRALTQDEVAEEVRNLVRHGHKRVLLVAGESYPQEGFRYILDCIDTIYRTKEGPGEIRRVTRWPRRSGTSSGTGTSASCSSPASRTRTRASSTSSTASTRSIRPRKAPARCGASTSTSRRSRRKSSSS